MSTGDHQDSARIYPFVPRTRVGRSSRRDRAAAVVELMPQRPHFCEFGSGSYHDAAIQEERTRKP